MECSLSLARCGALLVPSGARKHVKIRCPVDIIPTLYYIKCRTMRTPRYRDLCLCALPKPGRPRSHADQSRQCFFQARASFCCTYQLVCFRFPTCAGDVEPHKSLFRCWHARRQLERHTVRLHPMPGFTEAETECSHAQNTRHRGQLLNMNRSSAAIQVSSSWRASAVVSALDYRHPRRELMISRSSIISTLSSLRFIWSSWYFTIFVCLNFCAAGMAWGMCT